MKTLTHSQGLLRKAARPILGAVLLVGSLLASGAPVLAAPASRPADTLPASTCTLSAGAFACDLWAMQGTASLPGLATPVAIWGYAATSTGPATLLGPTLIVTQGVPVSITLHNVNLPSATSLALSGQPIIPDTVGVTAGNSTIYSFTTGILKPGTYLYEAGLTADGPRQVAMGLYGALIVRPASCGAAATCAYDANSAYDDEALLVLSELDPAFNAAPTTFDMSGFAPKYWLINGKVYPNTDPISTNVNRKVLLRYVNAGLIHHSMTLSGLRQTIYATDAAVATYPQRVVAQTIPAGGTLDTIVTMPASAPANAKYALFEAAMRMDNTGIATGGVLNFGGMLTFLTVAGVAGGNVGPVTSAVAIAPTPTNGSAPATLSATLSDSDGVAAAEYFVDVIGANGAGCAMTGTTSASATIPVSGATAPCVDLTTLSSASHTFYVHGRDTLGAWGTTASAVLTLDKVGPAISNTSLTPSRTNGTADVTVQATASDVATGNQSVTAAEYFIDPVGTPAGGTGTSIAVAAPATSVSLNATLAAATVNGLAEGNHTVAIRAQDALGNWGAFSNLALVVDKTSPVASSVVVTPTPNNGTLGVQVGTGGTLYLRIDGTVSDPLGTGVNSYIVAAEYFIDPVGTPVFGTGGAMIPTDGAFNSPSEAAYGAVDLFVLNQLGVGPHTICVRGKDAAGNWGACATATLIIDKTGPTTSGVALTPVASNNTAVAIAASATDAATGNSNIAGGEVFIDTIGANGTGIALNAVAAAPATTIAGSIPAATVAGLTAGNHTIFVHARDAAGNWGGTVTAVLLIDRTPPTFTSITVSPNSIPQGTASVNLTVNGATDPLAGGLASGLAGGEYWFDTASIPTGTGTAFTGLSGINVATAVLTGGTHTLRVRVRDVAGNWSIVRTATLTVIGPPPDAIFLDGFEAPTTLPGNWTSVTPAGGFGAAIRRNVTTAAALVGANGLQAQGNNTNYVQFDFGSGANPATATYDARFYFNPHGNTGTNQDILAAATSSGFGTTLFRVRYRWNGGSPQVQIQVGTGNANATWSGIANAANRVEVVWQSASSLQLYVNGTLVQTLTATTGSVASVRMGSITSGGNATLEYFDAFVSKRSVTPLIGP